MTVEIEVPFHDVDAGWIVWHGHYYKYLEIARTALARKNGMDVEDVLAIGCRMVVTETRCRHVHPLRYGDRVQVKAWFRELTPRIVVAYDVTNVTEGRRAARAHTTLVTTDAEGNLLPQTPDALLQGR